MTKIRHLTPDGPGKGGWGSPFKKKSGAAIFLRVVMGPLGGGVIVKGVPPLCVREGGVLSLTNLI